MKWVELIYNEDNFARSVATTITGIIGLIIYLIFFDWVIAFISLIISFPLMRLIASYFHNKIEKEAKNREMKAEFEDIYNQLSKSEKEVIQGFLSADSCVLLFKQANTMELPYGGIESLIQRDMLRTSMTADGIRETFVLDSLIFDTARNLEDEK